MGSRLLREAQYARQQWRNGGGVTAEIWRETMPDGEFLWRLSMADVASDGPFSQFPGCDQDQPVAAGDTILIGDADVEIGAAMECILALAIVRQQN